MRFFPKTIERWGEGSKLQSVSPSRRASQVQLPKPSSNAIHPEDDSAEPPPTISTLQLASAKLQQESTEVSEFKEEAAGARVANVEVMQELATMRAEQQEMRQVMALLTLEVQRSTALFKSVVAAASKGGKGSPKKGAARATSAGPTREV